MNELDRVSQDLLVRVLELIDTHPIDNNYEFLENLIANIEARLLNMDVEFNAEVND